jgi:uncharacterized phiE125 gp8 family phage protein
MMKEYKVVTPPSVEPVTLDELKRHCRVFTDDDGEEAYLTSLGKAAREYLEVRTCRSFVSQTIDAALDGFPESSSLPIKLLYPPLQSVTSITYVDGSGATQTLAEGDYTVVSGTPGLVTPAYGESWPATSDRPGSVVVRFVAGYGDAAAVPEAAKLCIRWLVGQWYEQRQPITTGTIVAETPYMLDALAASLFWGSYP